MWALADTGLRTMVDSSNVYLGSFSMKTSTYGITTIPLAGLLSNFSSVTAPVQSCTSVCNAYNATFILPSELMNQIVRVRSKALSTTTPLSGALCLDPSNGPLLVALEWTFSQSGFASPSYPALDYVQSSPQQPTQVLVSDISVSVSTGPVPGFCAVVPGSAAVYVYAGGALQILTLANGMLNLEPFIGSLCCVVRLLTTTNAMTRIGCTSYSFCNYQEPAGVCTLQGQCNCFTDFTSPMTGCDRT